RGAVGGGDQLLRRRVARGGGGAAGGGLGAVAPAGGGGAAAAGGAAGPASGAPHPCPDRGAGVVIDHVNIPVADVARARDFYAAVLAPLGYRLMTDDPEGAGFGVTEGWGQSPDPGGDFWVLAAEAPQTLHFAFSAATREVVAAFHASALAVGGRDNGAPGLRPHYHACYYAAFVLDPDGHNVEAVCHAG